VRLAGVEPARAVVHDFEYWLSGGAGHGLVASTRIIPITGSVGQRTTHRGSWMRGAPRRRRQYLQV